MATFSEDMQSMVERASRDMGVAMAEGNTHDTAYLATLANELRQAQREGVNLGLYDQADLMPQSAPARRGQGL